MIIESSSIKLESQHEKTVTTSSSFDLEAFKLEMSQARESFNQSLTSSLLSANIGSMSGSFLGGGQNTDSADSLSVKSLFPENFFERFNARKNEDDIWAGSSSIRAGLFAALMQALSNNQYFTPAEQEPVIADEASPQPQPKADTETTPTTELTASVEVVNLNVSFTQQRTEYECTQFSACGQVQTADGRSIDLNLNLSMERSYSETLNLEASAQQIRFKDPLILNFNGYAAELTDEQYDFDIDADGALDSLFALGENSAMLALDNNGDGMINDGTELFGALSGDGFADLAQYDEDNNQFIDAADSIFDELLLWSQSKDAEQLTSLADSGIGAIYLGSTSTPFDLKNEDNTDQGRVVETGIYLTEAGSVGTAQQIDLVV